MMTPKSEVDIRGDISKAPTPNQFIRACQGGYLDIVKKTLQPVKDSRDYLSLVYMGMRKSVEGGFLDIFKYLVDNTELNFLHWNDEELLRSAIDNEYSDIVEYLYSLGANTPKWTEKSLRMDEGIRDMMTPKSEEEIRKSLEVKPPKSKISFGTANDIPWLVMQGIEEDKNINVRDEDNYLLIWACEKGHIPLVKLLIERGADLHDQDDRALTSACYYNHPELVEFLLDKGANPEADRGYLLSAISMKGYYKITEFLLKAGAKKKIDQAIRMAKNNGYNDILELLQKYIHVNESIRDMMTPKSGKDVEKSIKRMIKNRTPDQRLILGAREGVVQVVIEALKDGADIELWDGLPLAISTIKGYTDVVEVLLKNNAVIHPKYLNKKNGYNKDIIKLLQKYSKTNESVRDKMTPISKETIINKFINHEPEVIFDVSFKHNLVDLLKIALDKGVNPDYETDRGTPYICLACVNGMYDYVKMLLEYGASVNIRGRRDRTPLIESITSGNKDVVELLLKNGAAVNLRDDVGETALMYTVDVDIAKLLIQYGADITIESNYGKTALDYARELHRYDVFKYLRTQPIIKESLRDQMTPKSEDDILKTLGGLGEYEKMKQGARYGILSLIKPILDKESYMPTIMDDIFNIACKYGNINIIQYLSSLKNFNYVLHNYIEGFKNAVSGGHVDVVELLLNIEPDIPIEDNQNWALRLAVSNGNLELVKLLLSKGADINKLKFSRGSVPNRTPLELMRDRGFDELADYIEQYTQTNESVRDQMTPKDIEIIKPLIIKQTSDSIGYYNPFEWGWKLDDKIQDYIYKFKSDDGRLWTVTICDDMIDIVDKIKHHEYHFWDIKKLEDFLRSEGFEKEMNESIRDKMTPKSELEILQKLNKKDVKKNLKMAIDENLVHLAYAIVKNTIDLDDTYIITYSILSNMTNKNDEMTPMLCEFFKRDLDEPIFKKLIEETEKFNELYKIVKQSKNKRVVDVDEPHVIKTIEQTHTPFLTSFFQFEITTLFPTAYTRNIVTVDFRLNMPELKSDWNFKYVIKWSKNRDNKEFLSWSLPTEELKKFFKENIYNNFNLKL